MDCFWSNGSMNFQHSEKPIRKSYFKPRNPQNPNRNRGNGFFGLGCFYDLPKSNQESRRFSHRKRKPGHRFFAPYAPRNTTSFIIRAKKSGGIASLVSPYQVTPTVLPTPIFSPSREELVDSAEEEWGVDGYGSMSGLIRLRSPGKQTAEDEDRDLSRFEMIFPSSGGGGDGWTVCSQFVRLKEENLTLKDKVILMENELQDLRWRVQCMETYNNGGGAVSENASENDGGLCGEVSSEKLAGDCDPVGT